MKLNMVDEVTIRNSCCHISRSSRRLGVVVVIFSVVVDSLLFSPRLWHVHLLMATLVFVCCSYEADAMLENQISESTTEEVR